MRHVMRATDPKSSSPAPTPGVLDDDERMKIELRFGVAEAQVRRDHVISHTLAAIASIGTDDVVFFGGTALSRTLLTTIRLSEDIDLIARDRMEIGDRLESSITTHLRGTLGQVTFAPRFRDTRHPNPSAMQVGGISIQIQLLSSDGYPAWPTEVVDIEQRYSDAPPARLRVLTPAAFVASKLAQVAGSTPVGAHSRRRPGKKTDVDLVLPKPTCSFHPDGVGPIGSTTMSDVAGPHVRQMTSILLQRGTQILLLRREGSRVIDTSWVGIGGHVEDDETSEPARAALRELHEELAITQDQIRGLRLRYVATCEVSDEVRVTYYYTATLLDDAPLPEQCDEGILAWFAIDADLTALPMPTTARIALDHWQRAGRFDDLTRLIAVAQSGEVVMTGANAA